MKIVSHYFLNNDNNELLCAIVNELLFKNITFPILQTTEIKEWPF